MSGWNPGTLFIRHKQGDRSDVREHHCWQKDLFIASLAASYADVNAKAKQDEPRYSFELVERSDYLRERAR